MKKIHLIRHAKSSWEDETLADIDRPLNDRGIRTSLFMAQHIYDAGCHFDHVFCSPALRAVSTIEFIRSRITQTEVQWQIDHALYAFDSHELFDWCLALDESIKDVVIIGHNPALTDFCNELGSCNIKNIPTCGYVQLVMSKKRRWKELADGCAEMSHFLKPKAFMS